MEFITDMAATGIGGGLFGILGTGLGRVARYFERKQEQAHQVKKWAHETVLYRLQREAQKEEAEAQLLKAELIGRWQGLNTSIEAERGLKSSYKWVDALRALTRPGLTFLLWVIAIIIFFVSPSESKVAIAEAAIFAASAATLWWFGDRGPHIKPIKK